MAASDFFTQFLCSLPFMYGFASDRWLHKTDVMLEKKKGARKIDLLRIIGLLEAVFNTALIFILCRPDDDYHGREQLI